MHVGINALAVAERPHGVGTYIKQLVAALAAIDSGEDYTVFASQSGRPHLEAVAPKMRYEMAPANRPLRLLWEQVQLPRLVKARKVDVFHGATFTLPLWKTSRQVVSIHDMTFHLTPERHIAAKRYYFQQMIPRACHQADAVIAISESTKRDLVALLGVGEKKIFVVHHGVPGGYRRVTDENRLEEVRRKLGLRRPFILHVGMLEPRKNLKTLVEAYRSAADIHGQYDLVLAGGYGWGYEPLLAQIKGSGLTSIRVTGYVPEEDLPPLYSQAAVFVYPSVYEGFGLPVLEAMAFEVPVITSNVSSMPEVAGDAAALLAPEDVNGLVDAMRKVLGSRDLQTRMAAAGLARARTFTWEAAARKTLDVYRAACGKA
jgi:glycosyltransferase involved in cell wall biosynthesis